MLDGAPHTQSLAARLTAEHPAAWHHKVARHRQVRAATEVALRGEGSRARLDALDTNDDVMDARRDLTRWPTATPLGQRAAWGGGEPLNFTDIPLSPSRLKSPFDPTLSPLDSILFAARLDIVCCSTRHRSQIDPTSFAARSDAVRCSSRHCSPFDSILSLLDPTFLAARLRPCSQIDSTLLLLDSNSARPRLRPCSLIGTT
uniref:Uncharacterized protein n=1 Tax=Plectus sambesii TaxID=2011161 RepID=A0A914XQ72_9BILA